MQDVREPPIVLPGMLCPPSVSTAKFTVELESLDEVGEIGGGGIAIHGPIMTITRRVVLPIQSFKVISAPRTREKGLGWQNQ